jgi:hypothetical protein
MTHVNAQFPLAPSLFVVKVIPHFHPPAAAVFPPSRRGQAPLQCDDGSLFNQKHKLTRESFQRHRQ